MHCWILNLCLTLCHFGSASGTERVQNPITSKRQRVEQRAVCRYPTFKLQSATVQFTSISDQKVVIPRDALTLGQFVMEPILVGHESKFFFMEWQLDINSFPHFLALDHQYSFPCVPNSAIEHVKQSRFTRDTAGRNMVRYRYTTKINLNALVHSQSLEVLHKIHPLSHNSTRWSGVDYTLEIATQFSLYDTLVKEIGIHFDDNRNSRRLVPIPFKFG